MTFLESHLVSSLDTRPKFLHILPSIIPTKPDHILSLKCSHSLAFPAILKILPAKPPSLGLSLNLSALGLSPPPPFFFLLEDFMNGLVWPFWLYLLSLC